ncbi:MAG: hypothetical protein IJS13_08325 [Paludibacteraceae bacterium]|nr:hypothetical protein [Paludibacteraceae bacterium]
MKAKHIYQTPETTVLRFISPAVLLEISSGADGVNGVSPEEITDPNEIV